MGEASHHTPSCLHSWSLWGVVAGLWPTCHRLTFGSGVRLLRPPALLTGILLLIKLRVTKHAEPRWSEASTFKVLNLNSQHVIATTVVIIGGENKNVGWGT